MIGIAIALTVAVCYALWHPVATVKTNDQAEQKISASGKPEKKSSCDKTRKTASRKKIVVRKQNSPKKPVKAHHIAQKPTCSNQKKASPAIQEKSVTSVLAKTGITRKSAYQTLKKGTTLLFDTANLVGKLGPEYASACLTAIATALEERGYKTCFYWERRAFNWAWRRQVNAEDVAAIKAFSRRRDVSIVGEESDLAMLQAARSISDSVIVTQDRLGDYAETYQDVVSTSRHRSFSLATVGGRRLLTIFGLEEAIEIPACERTNDECVASSPAQDMPVATAASPKTAADAKEDLAIELDEDVIQSRSECPVVVPRRWGLLGVADDCLARGENHRAFALIDRVARTRPKYYREIADAFASGYGVRQDSKEASRYDRLADRREKALRERLRRNRRLRAERRRGALSLRAAA